MKKLILAVLFAMSLFGFNSIHQNINSAASEVIQGKVIKAYTAPGYGRGGYDWLFMDVKSNNGKIYKVAIAPTFRISNLPIKEGDEVKVSGFVPPMFPSDVTKAVDVYDVTQKRDYPIAGYGCGGWHRGCGGWHHRSYGGWHRCCGGWYRGYGI